MANTVGAGDAFCAALTYALASGVAPERALAAAVADPRSPPRLAVLDEYLS